MSTAARRRRIISLTDGERGDIASFRSKKEEPLGGRGPFFSQAPVGARKKGAAWLEEKGKDRSLRPLRKRGILLGRPGGEVLLGGNGKGQTVLGKTLGREKRPHLSRKADIEAKQARSQNVGQGSRKPQRIGWSRFIAQKIPIQRMIFRPQRSRRQGSKEIYQKKKHYKGWTALLLTRTL